MRHSKIQSVICAGIVALLFFSSLSTVMARNTRRQAIVFNVSQENSVDDWDPTVDLSVNITVKRIQVLIPSIDAPPSQVDMTITVNDIEHSSEMYEGYNIFPNWTIKQDVPDDVEKVAIQLVSSSTDGQYHTTSVNAVFSLSYSLKTGKWTGDDFLKDSNGYGHLVANNDNGNGIELWFDITQNDYDGDTLTYWEETNEYHTDPRISNLGEDNDDDGVPIEWEDKWGYDPFSWDNHAELDPDTDGLQNSEEWKTAQWLSDPYHQDVFIEVDWKEGNAFLGSNEMPEISKQVLKSRFTEHNIMLRFDDGNMGGGEEIPADDFSAINLRGVYRQYFLHGMTNTWRQGIFHYALLMGLNPWKINMGGFNYRHDAFVVCRGTICLFRWKPAGRLRATTSLFMHELGHNLGIFRSTFPGIDNPNTKFPWQADYYKYENYRSCMNYRYAWDLIQYSDGSHGENDFDDWGHFDLTHFEDR